MKVMNRHTLYIRWFSKSGLNVTHRASAHTNGSAAALHGPTPPPLQRPGDSRGVALANWIDKARVLCKLRQPCIVLWVPVAQHPAPPLDRDFFNQ